MAKTLDLPEPKLIRLRLKDILPNPGNTRKHNAEQIRLLERSLDQFGLVALPVVQAGTNKLIAGHGRLEALKKRLKPDHEIAVLSMPLSDKDAIAYGVADNRLTDLSEMDLPALKAAIAEVDDGEFDMEAMGYTEQALLDLFPIDDSPFSQKDGADPDKVPLKPKTPTTKLGDVWILGPHRLACGSSTEPAVVALALGEVPAAHLVLTDPPYGIGFKYGEHDDGSNDDNAKLVGDAFALHPCGKVWTPGGMNLGRELARFPKAKVLIWDKCWQAGQSGLGGACTWEPILADDPADPGQWEPILVFPLPGTRKLKNDVLKVATDRPKVGGVKLGDLHPCPKPVQLYTMLLTAFTQARDVVFEPFSGSGTTLIACHLTGRICCAVEVDPAYVDVAVLRWQEVSGQKAVLMRGGKQIKSPLS